LLPVAAGVQVATNTTLPTIATVQAKRTKPAQSSDLTAANCCFVVKRDPAYNLIIKPIVGHATAPADLWGQAYIVGVRELAGPEGTVLYIREQLGILKFQGSATTFTPAAGTYWPGLGEAPTQAVWAGCDVLDTTPYLPSPAIMELGEVTDGWGSFAFDAWSHPWIEIYPVCAVPSGAGGSPATAVTFWYTEC
jgi:hypothetical protein